METNSGQAHTGDLAAAAAASSGDGDACIGAGGTAASQLPLEQQQSTAPHAEVGPDTVDTEAARSVAATDKIQLAAPDPLTHSAADRARQARSQEPCGAPPGPASATSTTSTSGPDPDGQTAPAASSQPPRIGASATPACTAHDSSSSLLLAAAVGLDLHGLATPPPAVQKQAAGCCDGAGGPVDGRATHSPSDPHPSDPDGKVDAYILGALDGLGADSLFEQPAGKDPTPPRVSEEQQQAELPLGQDPLACVQQENAPKASPAEQEQQKQEGGEESGQQAAAAEEPREPQAEQHSSQPSLPPTAKQPEQLGQQQAHTDAATAHAQDTSVGLTAVQASCPEQKAGTSAMVPAGPLPPPTEDNATATIAAAPTVANVEPEDEQQQQQEQQQRVDDPQPAGGLCQQEQELHGASTTPDAATAAGVRPQQTSDGPSAAIAPTDPAGESPAAPAHSAPTIQNGECDTGCGTDAEPQARPLTQSQPLPLSQPQHTPQPKSHPHPTQIAPAAAQPEQPIPDAVAPSAAATPAPVPAASPLFAAVTPAPNSTAAALPSTAVTPATAAIPAAAATPATAGMTPFGEGAPTMLQSPCGLQLEDSVAELDLADTPLGPMGHPARGGASQHPSQHVAFGASQRAFSLALSQQQQQPAVEVELKQLYGYGGGVGVITLAGGASQRLTQNAGVVAKVLSQQPSDPLLLGLAHGASAPVEEVLQKQVQVEAAAVGQDVKHNGSAEEGGGDAIASVAAVPQHGCGDGGDLTTAAAAAEAATSLPAAGGGGAGVGAPHPGPCSQAQHQQPTQSNQGQQPVPTHITSGMPAASPPCPEPQVHQPSTSNLTAAPAPMPTATTTEPPQQQPPPTPQPQPQPTPQPLPQPTPQPPRPQPPPRRKFQLPRSQNPTGALGQGPKAAVGAATAAAAAAAPAPPLAPPEPVVCPYDDATLVGVLQQHFALPGFRPGQLEAVRATLAGGRKVRCWHGAHAAPHVPCPQVPSLMLLPS